MAFSAQAVANFFLEQNQPMTMMRLQMLMVISQGYWLAKHNVSLFEEDIVATRGIILSIWNEFKVFGDDQIDSGVHSLVFTPGQGVVFPRVRSEEALKVLNLVWNVYGDMEDKVLYACYKLEDYSEIAMKIHYKELLGDIIKSQQVEKLKKMWELS